MAFTVKFFESPDMDLASDLVSYSLCTVLSFLVVLVCLHTHSDDDTAVGKVNMIWKHLRNLIHVLDLFSRVLSSNCLCYGLVFNLVFGIHTLAPGESLIGAAWYLPLPFGIHTWTGDGLMLQDMM